MKEIKGKLDGLTEPMFVEYLVCARHYERYNSESKQSSWPHEAYSLVGEAKNISSVQSLSWVQETLL